MTVLVQTQVYMQYLEDSHPATITVRGPQPQGTQVIEVTQEMESLPLMIF